MNNPNLEVSGSADHAEISFSLLRVRVCMLSCLMEEGGVGDGRDDVCKMEMQMSPTVLCDSMLPSYAPWLFQ